MMRLKTSVPWLFIPVLAMVSGGLAALWVGAQQPAAPVTPASVASSADTLAKVMAARQAVAAAQQALADAMAAHVKALEGEYGPWTRPPAGVASVAPVQPPAAKPHVLTEGALLEQTRRAVAVVLAEDGTAAGSAVLVTPDRLLTAASVVNGAKKVPLRFAAGAALEADVVATDPSGVVVLKAAAGDREPLAAARGQVGEPVWVVGNVFTDKGGLRSGKLINVSPSKMFTDAPARVGAALVNAKGELLGIVAGAGETGTWAVPVGAVARLLTK